MLISIKEKLRDDSTTENLNILKISLVMKILLLLLTTSKSLVITSNGIILIFSLPQKLIDIVKLKKNIVNTRT